MIVSASRRTDIPAHAMPWMMERLREGFAETVNPFNPNQRRRVELTPEAVDALVFWTKQPAALLPHLPELGPYRFLAQCTINDYDEAIEPGVPKLNQRLDAALALADFVGPRRHIWRYDPILINPEHPAEMHAERFDRIAGALEGRVRRVTISFLDDYPRIHKKLRALRVRFPEKEEQLSIASALAGIARRHGMEIVACCEPVDFTAVGVGRAACIDGALIQELWGGAKAKKDASQRPGCGCAAGADIGTYGTCISACAYCYARGFAARAASGGD